MLPNALLAMLAGCGDNRGTSPDAAPADAPPSIAYGGVASISSPVPDPLHSRDTPDDDLNSFCVNFDVQGEGGDPTDLAHLYARAVNDDISRSVPGQAVIKTMGVVDGVFRTLGDRITTCCELDQEYRMVVEVRGNSVTVRISQGATLLDEAVLDYTASPYTPDRSRPVRIGANEHGTDWTMRDLRVRYLD